MKKQFTSTLMKKGFIFGTLVLATFAVIMTSGFTPAKKQDGPVPASQTKAGKAYWFVTFQVKGKYYVSYVFNNDCDHCRIEIQAAFKKYLVMNDYESDVNTANMNTYHDVDRADLEKRRDDFIYDQKQARVGIQSVNFSYTEK